MNLMKTYISGNCGFLSHELERLAGDNLLPGTLSPDLPEDWA